VGEALPSITLSVTPRMALAFSAGIDDDAEACFDDASRDFEASPMFCVSLEWQLIVAARNRLLGLAPEEARRAVHAGQDTQFLRPLRPGVEVIIAGQIVAARQTRAGALSTSRLEVSEAQTGDLLSTTLSTALYRGVSVEGDDRSIGAAPRETPEPDDGFDVVETVIPLDRWFAHRYTECANIWNPIHTEHAAASAAGLSSIILHGTALWALAGRTLISRFAPNQPQRLRRLSGRFSAMVTAGSAITVRHARSSSRPGAARFTVLNAQRQEAVSLGYAEFGDP
jgi:acyl dehydratase